VTASDCDLLATVLVGALLPPDILEGHMLRPGRYFRLLLAGYFEGLDSERGMAWRAADSLAVRTFVGLDLDTAAPDHSTIRARGG
jgi:transposase